MVLAARPSSPAPPSLAELTKIPTRNSSPVRGLFWNMTCPVPRRRASMLATAGLVRVSLAQVSAARRGALAAAMTPLAPIGWLGHAAEHQVGAARRSDRRLSTHRPTPSRHVRADLVAVALVGDRAGPTGS